jgi:uroporphyrinogen-III synthase
LVSEVPVTSTVFHSIEEVRDAVAALDPSALTSISLTSARAARYLVCLPPSLQHLPLLCVGEATASECVRMGITPVAVCEGGGADLAPLLPEGTTLSLGALATLDTLDVAFAARGGVVRRVACYETVGRDLDGAEQATIATADAIFVGAPSSWHVICDLVQPSAWIVVPGEQTASVVRETHEPVIVGWNAQTLAQLSEFAEQK